jgi:hypothetical protein
VYDEEDQTKLRNIPGTKISMLDRYAQNLNNSNNTVVDGEMVFSNEVENYNEIDNTNLKPPSFMKCDENIDIDDI